MMPLQVQAALAVVVGIDKGVGKRWSDFGVDEGC